MAKNKSNIEQDISRVVAEGYFPGGAGGGGKKRGSGTRIVLPHARTSPQCKLCNRYHTEAEHKRHSGGKIGSGIAKPTAAKPKTKKPSTPKISAKPTSGSRPSGSKPKPATTKKPAQSKPKTEPASAKPVKLTADMAKQIREESGGDYDHEYVTPGKPVHNALEIVKQAARSAPKEDKFGPEKVFVSELWKRVGNKIGLSLPEFKHWLLQENREQRLDLVRADLVGAMAPNKVAPSEIRSLGATFHFVVADRNKRN